MILAVLTYPKLRRKSNIFVANLAIADLCVSSGVQGSNLAGKWLMYYPLSVNVSAPDRSTNRLYMLLHVQSLPS